MKDNGNNDSTRENGKERECRIGNSTFYIKRSFEETGSTLLEQLISYLLDITEKREKE